MRIAPRLILALSLLASAAPLAAQETMFSHPQATRDAERIVAAIAATAKGKAAPAPSAQARLAALKQLAEGQDPRAVSATLTQVLAANPKDTEAWLALARAQLAIETDKDQGSERYELPANASGAAYRALQLSTTPDAKAAALGVLSSALQRRSLWRPAMDALKISLSLAEKADVRAAFEALRSTHGFRIVDHKVDAELAEPRLCLNFSERLVGQPAELSKFLTVDGREPASVSGDPKQLCIDGLAHGKRYEVQVRAGLPADTGETLAKSAEIASYIRDRQPAVRFSGRAYVLPNRGQQGIPVVTINTPKVAVEIFRVGDRGLAGLTGSDHFLKQLQSHDIETIRDRQGQKIWSGELDVPQRRNEEVTTAIPVSEAVPKLAPGVYIASARVPAKAGNGNSDGDSNGSERERAAQWFIVSDLGLTALSGADGIHAFIRSLVSAKPVAGIGVRLVARNNEVLGTATTDANGYARFPAGLNRGEGGLAPALLVAEGGDDYAFLDLAAAAFDLTDRGVKGREPPGALDAYLFPERGVYRPGESVHLTGLVRDRNAKAAGLPVTLIIARPDGVEHRRIPLSDQGLGGRTTTLALGASAMTGTWRAKLHSDPKADPIAQTAFLVEDFVPERLDLKLEPARPAIATDDTLTISATGRYLYGPPAGGLDMEGDVIVRLAKGDLPGFAGYQFGNAEEKFTAVRRPLEALPQTDANGAASIAVRLPPVPKTARPLEADVLVRLREAGGRTIERKTTVAVTPAEPRIGIKPRFADARVGEGESAEFDLVLLGPDGKLAPSQAFKWEIVKLDQRWQWYSRNGQWAYEPVTTARRLATGATSGTPTLPARVTFKPEWGRYRIDVTADGSAVSRTTVAFQSGWHAAETLESPETLDIALDKATYKAGETARLRIASKEAGRAHIAVLAGGLLVSKQVDVAAGGTDVALEVDESWRPGVYVTATLYRGMDEAAKRMPSRAIGVKWLALDMASDTLKIALDAPAKVRPASKLTVPIKISGLASGEEARVTVAAVDVGILNLTRFEAPAPEAWFHAQRKLGIEIRDFWGRLIDGMRAERGKLRSGGDGPGGMSLQGSPPVEAPLSLYSGIVKVGPDGTAEVTFDIPDFNGSVRLMAVAWSNGRVGSAVKEVIVRDQLALTATAPRFLTLGDTAQLALDVHNIEGPAAAYKVAIAQETDAGAASSLPGRELVLKPGERRRETVAIKPSSLGRMTYDVRVSGPGGIEVRRRLAFDVKPPAGDIKRRTVASLKAGGGNVVLSKDLLGDLIPSSVRVSLNVGPAAALDVAALMTELDRYPYGCAEQTTSRALPLLYVNDMAKRLGLGAESEIRERVQKAIDRVFEMQDASGAFGIWGPEGSDLWLSAYVTDFLTRAKETGYSVRPQPFAQALDRLAGFLSYAQDFEKGGEDRAYALYVLARNGRAPVGDLRYYVDTRLDRFATPLAQAQLGAALALTGDKERAEKAFKAAMVRLEGSADATKSFDRARSDYGSLVRDGAGILTLAAETGALNAEVPKLAGVLSRAYRTRTYTSTQEQAWMLLAARALADEAKATRLTVNGVAHQGELTRRITPAEIDTSSLTVANTGDTSVDAVVTVHGASLTPEPAVAKGFTIERAYYTLDGKKVELASATGGSATLRQNDRLVVVLTLKGAEAGGRIMLVDRLPAGLEIENPRLVESGDLKGLDVAKNAKAPEHTEFRDDRFVAAFNFFGDKAGKSGDSEATATLAYIVRAVTPGSFVHPAATVEDMYRPDRYARTASGRLDITAKN